MKHLIFAPEQTQYEIVILIKDAHFNQNELNNHYVQPLKQAGISEDKIIAFSLPYDKKKVSNAQIRAYLTQFTLIVNKLGIKYIYCADAEYFKVLTKQTKTDVCFGYFFESTLPTTNPVQVVIGLNHAGLIYNPGQLPKLALSIQTLADLYCNKYQALGLNVIKSAQYPQTAADIAAFLDSLHTHKSLTCDIEAFSLNAFEAGIGSIAFAWDKHSGGAFLVDFKTTDVAVGYYGRKQKNIPVRLLLRQFFKQYKGNLKFHNATYDVKVLILELFMAHSQDYKGMLQGLELLTANMDDTRIIAYLALNTTAELSLGLKSLSHEYAGNYAQDEINDIRRIHPTELLRYNLMDCLSTWYVYDKYYPVMVADNQQNIYDTLMRPSLKILIQIELVGMPIDLNRVTEVEAQLVSIQNTHIASLKRSAVIQDCQKVLQLKELTAINSKLKTKQHGMDKVADYTFNPNSNQHLNELLYSVMQLPVLDRTPSKQPSTGAATLEKLLNHTTNQDYIDVLNALIGLSKVDKILTAFIPSFLKAEVKRKGAWLHGSFNLGGTVSGRLSSSNPNLQNIPSGSIYGKLIKSCFKAEPGWVFAGADYNALEDKINTVLTKDPNKVKVWVDGYDAHCYRAYYYWKEKMPDIVDTVESINSIKKKYDSLRSLSKRPSFALQYAGTYITLMNQCGFSEAEAKQIEANYHKMYAASDQWVQQQLDLCCKQGYIDVAFGLRIRTPLLAKSILGNSKTLTEAQAEARSVSNAISGQSYGLLNNRAAIAFMERVWASEYRYSVFLVSLIHDAIYLIMKDDIEVVEWVNNALTEEMAWQDLPEIQHPQVKLSAELDVFYNGWHQPITLPNKATKQEILKICKAGVEKYNSK